MEKSTTRASSPIASSAGEMVGSLESRIAQGDSRGQGSHGSRGASRSALDHQLPQAHRPARAHRAHAISFARDKPRARRRLAKFAMR